MLTAVVNQCVLTYCSFVEAVYSLPGGSVAKCYESLLTSVGSAHRFSVSPLA